MNIKYNIYNYYENELNNNIIIKIIINKKLFNIIKVLDNFYNDIGDNDYE